MKRLAALTDSPDQLELLLQHIEYGRLEKVLKLDTSTAAQLEYLVRSVANQEALSNVLAKVEELGGTGGFMQASQTITNDTEKLSAILKLETDLTVLGQLQALIQNADVLTKVLKSTSPPGGRRGQFLLDTIQLAGGWNRFRALSFYSYEVTVLRALLDRVPYASLQAAGTGSQSDAIKGKGATISQLLDFTDFDTIVRIIGQHPRATLSELRLLATEVQLEAGAPGNRVHPMAIRFTQARVTNGGDVYTVRDNIRQLQQNPNWDIPAPPIRVFKKTEELNRRVPEQWTEFGIASPYNLENGEIYTLDNRRLYAYQKAGRDSMPAPVFVPLNVVVREAYKFTTENGGRTAELTS